MLMGAGQWSMELIFARSGPTHSMETIWPRYSIEVWVMKHLDCINYNSWSSKRWNTMSRFCKCSSHTWLYTKVSSKKTITKRCKYGSKMRFTVVWNVEGELQSPNGITRNLLCLWCVRNVVLWISMEAMGIWWYPERRSNLERDFVPYN